MKGMPKTSADMLPGLVACFCGTAGGRAGQQRRARLDRRSMMFSLLSIVAAPIFGRRFSLNFQHPQPRAAKPSGVTTGGEYAAVYDEHHRPITAGGFVDGAEAVYEDCTRQSGLTAFKHRCG